MNKIEYLFNKAMECVIDDQDLFVSKVGTWVDKYESIDFFMNGMAIDVTDRKKNKDDLLSIKSFEFAEGVTGFIKYCNGHIKGNNMRQELSVYVLVLKFDYMSMQEMKSFCKTMPDIQDMYWDAIDEYEASHCHMAKKSIPMSYFSGPCPAFLLA